jgi:hypothetical protein
VQKLLLILLCLPILFSSCEKCKDCELKYETELSMDELNDLVYPGYVGWEDYFNNQGFFVNREACGAEDIAMFESMEKEVWADSNNTEYPDVLLKYECK